jgi:hypothetical protein
MNILPLVISLLLIFSFFTNTLFVKHKNSTLASKSFSGYMIAKRDAENEYQSEVYRLIDAKPIKKQKKTNQNNPQKDAKKRLANPLNAKINITSLFLENNQDLYNLVKSLIHNLYKNKSFYYDNLEIYLLNNLIEEAKVFLKDEKNSLNNLNLCKISFKDKQLNDIYYKMLKGTKFYIYKKNIGFPSLLDYIDINLHTAIKIPIIDASFEVLEIIFNEKIAFEILERQKSYPIKNLSKEDVEKLSLGFGKKPNDIFFKYLDFSKRNKNTNKIIVGIDEISGIKVRKNLNK